MLDMLKVGDVGLEIAEQIYGLFKIRDLPARIS